MTLILKLDLDMNKYTCIPKMKFLCQQFKSYSLNRQKHRQTDRHTHTHTHRQTHRQTDRHDWNITYPHTQVVKMPTLLACVLRENSIVWYGAGWGILLTVHDAQTRARTLTHSTGDVKLCLTLRASVIPVLNTNGTVTKSVWNYEKWVFTEFRCGSAR